MQAKAKRFLGIELGGSRRNAVVALDYVASEKKIYLVGLMPHLHATKMETADDVLIKAVNSFQPEAIGVDAPLSFPPCFECQLPRCPRIENCTVDAVEWMREETKRRKWDATRFPPPYSNRPIDLLLRGEWQDDTPVPIPVEESFGSGRAPLAVRINYLRKHFECQRLLEVNPRYAMAGIAEWFHVSLRELLRARDLESGAENRFQILTKLSKPSEVHPVPHLFLYISEVVSLAKDLTSFDALLCALMAVYQEAHLLEPTKFPESWGYVAKPKGWRKKKRREE